MGMREFRAAVGMIERDSGGGDFVGPRPEELVRRAEAVLGVRFPPTYRQFLRELGCGAFEGDEFYGICADREQDLTEGPVPNGIWLTLDQREEAHLPPHMVLVGFDGMSGYYALDLSRLGADGEAPVVVWEAGAPSTACERIASDFGTFFRNQVAQALGDDGDDEEEDDDEE